MKNIVLFGFMGCGKTTVGAKLAQKAGLLPLDTDLYLEEKYGRRIGEIFALDGEAAFRRMEQAVCAELAERDGLVLCCGGGTVLAEENARLLSQSGRMVFLSAPFAVCYKRIQTSDRPLVRQNTREGLHKIFSSRQPVYLSRAELTVNAAAPPEQVADAILAAIGQI